MQISNAIAKLEKAGFTVRCTHDVTGEFARGRRFMATMPGPYRVEFSGRDEDIQCGFRVIRVNDHDDPQSDYSAGSGFKTLAKALAWCVRSNAEACEDMRYVRASRANVEMSGAGLS